MAMFDQLVPQMLFANKMGWVAGKCLFDQPDAEYRLLQCQCNQHLQL
jgi:hypothetical protein